MRHELIDDADHSLEHERYRRILLDRYAVLTQQRNEMFNMTDKRDRAILELRKLRDRMASLTTGNSVPVSIPVASTNSISGTASQHTLRIRRRQTESVRANSCLYRHIPSQIISFDPRTLLLDRTRLVNEGDRLIPNSPIQMGLVTLGDQKILTSVTIT